MRIAILTDVHANREALQACLEHARDLGVERYAFLGDLVGYGADPAWVLDAVIGLVERGAVAVLGNHDAAVLHGPSKYMSPDARLVIEWTRRQLDQRHIGFLSGLPLTRAEGDVLFVHANAWQPAGWEYIETRADARRSMLATTCRYTFCGHVHDPGLYHMSTDTRVAHFTPVPGSAIPLGARRYWLAIAGSAGQPRDGLPAACYAVFDLTARAITYYRVPYDVPTAAAKIRAAGLPEKFVVLLEHGHAAS